MIIQYNNIPQSWENGLPCGNGRLAAMLWGQTEDILSLNHEWIWTGNYKKRENQKSAHYLQAVREYIKNGEYFRANALAALAFGGNGGISPLPRRMDSYQPAGELYLSYADADAQYSMVRTLDMENGIVQSCRQYAHYTVTATVYCDCEADVIAVQWRSTQPISFSLRYVRETQEQACGKGIYQDGGFSYCHALGEGVSYEVQGHVQADGTVKAMRDSLEISNATELTAVINIGTAHAGIAKELAQNDILQYNFTKGISAHKAKFSAEMGKSELVLSNDAKRGTPYLNELIAQRTDKTQDPYLITVYARFAQYLMVSGSICAQLPLNLQGKWNRDIQPKWNSDYHLNINLQMNYWFTDSMGYSRYTRQMLDYLCTLLPSARRAARDLYGCRGILYPLNSDIWGNCTAEAYNYAVWIACAGWLCEHFISYYVHTGDKDYLRDVAYPFIKEAVQFYEDYFVYGEDGSIKIMPSQSPENKFEGGGYFPISVCANSAMDVQVAYDTFRFAIFAAKELNQDDDSRLHWSELLGHMPPFTIGKDGRLLEWDTDDKIETEPGHRHVSHLFGVYPAGLFTPDTHKAQYEAARKALDYRLAHSGGHTGWSCAWAACLYARFLDGEAVNDTLLRLVCKLSSSTLLDLHPNYYPQNVDTKRTDEPALFTKPSDNPPMIFQIDGNLGACAALAQALAQYRDGAIYLLPAADKGWVSGSVKGMIMPYGTRIDFTWGAAGITQLTVTVGYSGKAVLAALPQVIAQDGVRVQDNIVEVRGHKGQRFILIGDGK